MGLASIVRVVAASRDISDFVRGFVSNKARFDQHISAEISRKPALFISNSKSRKCE
jgi:hypothetical protein